MPILDFLGQGLARPFRRAGADLARADGEALVRSAVAQVLGTEQGELPWNPRFGSRITTYRHQNMDEVMEALVKTEVQAALAVWEPRIQVLEVAATRVRNDNRLDVSLTWAIIERNSPENQVLVGPVSQEIRI